jgi:hypothetical protein
MAAERENFAGAFANELSKAIYQGPTRAADNEPDISELKKLSSSLFDALMDRYDVVSFLMASILVLIFAARCVRSYTLGSGPITYQSFDERAKNKKAQETATGQPSEDETDTSLKDLKLALEYAKVELSMVFSKYEEALRKVINRGRAQNNENIMEYVNNLDSQQKLELTKAALSLLLGAHVH